MKRKSMDTLVKNRVAVDWDGTLVDDDRWPEMGDWLPYAPEAIHALAEIFDEVVIWSCRTASVELDEVTERNPLEQAWAIEAMLDSIDAPKNVLIWRKPYKPPAEFYVDNRALRFTGDWQHTLRQILGLRRPTNHQEERAPDSEPTVEDQVWYDELRAQEPKVVYTDAYRAVFPEEDPPRMRLFETGATRNVDDDQLDYEGFLSPLALHAFAEYMHEHRFQANGEVRASDNWQKGIPYESYMKSLTRHFMDLWLHWRDAPELAREADPKKVLAAILFNAQGALHEMVKESLLVIGEAA